MPIDFEKLVVGAIVRINGEREHRNENLFEGRLCEVVSWVAPNGTRKGEPSPDTTVCALAEGLLCIKVGPKNANTEKGWWNIRPGDAELVSLGSLVERHSHSQIMLNNISEMTEYHDTALVVEGRQFFAPGVLLAAASPVLKAMLNSPMKEGRERKIVMDGTSAQALEQFLIYINTGELNCSGSTLAEVIALGDKYDMQELLSMGADLACEGVKPDTAAVFMQALRSVKAKVPDKYTELSKIIREDATLFEGLVGDSDLARPAKFARR